ncbi:MAG TPA: short-chain fatty acyl-CoA regulator family protein [Devosiaceae bacterium]
MRAPIGIRIVNGRKSQGVSQAELARRIGISASYLNLIERNKRDVGGKLLQRIAAELGLGIEALTGESEQRLIHVLEEAFSDPVLEPARLDSPDIQALVAQSPAAAAAMARLYRAYGDAVSSAEAYANRLNSDPLLAELLHQILNHITAVRSSAEILEDVSDLSEADRLRFRTSINRDSRALSDVARTLIRQFERSAVRRRSLSPARELDDLIIQENNHFPALEEVAEVLRAEALAAGPFGEAALAAVLEHRFGVAVRRGSGHRPGETGFPGQYRYDADRRVMWFQGSTTAATRQFQLARLFAELAAPDVLQGLVDDGRLTSAASRRLGYRAMGSYVAGAMVLPYSRFLEDAERQRYDIDFLAQTYTASFEQVAHRLVTLRRPGEEGIAFGFLRSDPAGRLTKHFPLPGLQLPSVGHACPLWAIYGAFSTPGQVVRQIVRFPDNSRYLFVAKTVARRAATFSERAVPSSVQLATHVLNADRTVYADGLELSTGSGDVPVGPACRLCIRRECVHRQEEALATPGAEGMQREPLVPRGFDLGATD